LTQPNVEVIDGKIVSVTAEGLMTADGIEHKVDVIACATGFDTTFRPGFNVFGLNGRNLREEWRDSMNSQVYFSDMRSTFISWDDGCRLP
jgi:cation diffusion facilitator CzcD-associated flavoprotein CzcO